MIFLIYFLISEIFLHPCFVTISGLILFIIVINRVFPRLTRHLDSDDLFWYKSVPSLANIRLVWCDPSSEYEEETEQCLRRIDPNFVFIDDLSKIQETIEEIHWRQSKSILLILPGSIARELLPHVMPNVHAIFIFCFNREKNLDLLSQTKVDSISDSLFSLIQRIENCLSNIRYRLILENQQQSVRNLDKDEAAFIWFHSFRNLIRHFHKTAQAKTDMIEFFRRYYQNNASLLQKLEEFSNKYDPDDAIFWYTHSNLISDPLNKALRSFDVDSIFDLRYLIADLCDILEFLPRPIKKQPFYRAVLMDKAKFDTLRTTLEPGDLLSNRGFFSTSSNFRAAEIFGLNTSNDPDKVEVIYQINVASNLKDLVYADIGCFSYFREEEEILFDLDSVFELISITPDPEKPVRWIINMKTTDRGREFAEKYTADTSRQLKHLSANILFGKLLIDKGDHDKAIEYFQRVLSESDSLDEKLSRSSRSVIMNNIGDAWFKKGDYQQALQYFDAALTLQEEAPPLETLIPATMNNRGVIFMMNADWEPAMKAFERGRDLALQLEYYDELAAFLENIGTIQSQLGLADEALRTFEDTLEALRKAGVADDHWKVAETLMNIAFVFMHQARWQEALSTLEKVERIRRRVLPLIHVDIARTWFTIGVVLRSLERYDEAFDYLKRALTTYQQCLPEGHPYIANTYNSLAALKSVQKKFDEALPMYEEAKKQFLRWYSKDEHPDVARVLNNIGQSNRHLGHLNEAIENLKQALHLRQVTLGLEHPDTATTWVNLARVYRAQKDLPTALQHALCGLEIRRKKLQPNHEDLLSTEEFVRELEDEISRLNDPQ